MTGPAVVGLGEFGLGVASRLRAAGHAVLAVVEEARTASAAAAGPEVTRSVLDFATVELPPLRAEGDVRELDGAEVLALPEPTRAALESALSAVLPAPPAWLPPDVAVDPEGWLERAGERQRLDRIGVRLLWPRMEKSFAAAATRLKLTGERPVLLIGDGAEALVAGLLPEVLQAIRGASGASATVLLAACPADLAPGSCLDALLAELEALAVAAGADGKAGTAGAPAIVLLATGLDPALIPALAALPREALAGNAGTTYRGRPLVFSVARGARVQVAAAAAQWQVARRAARAALERLLARPSPASSGGVGTIHDLLEQVAIPSFAQVASRPLAELLREQRPPVFPPPAAGEEAETTRRRVDALFARRASDIADRSLRHEAEAKEWLHGGKISRLGTTTTPGFLVLISRSAVDKTAREGIESATVFLASLAAELRLRGAGAPRIQLDAKIADLERTRNALAAAARPGTRSLSSLLRGRDAGAREEGERALGEYVRVCAELLRLQEIDAVLGAAYEMWDACLEAVGQLEAELKGARTAAAAVLDAVDRSEPVEPLPEDVAAALAAEAGLTPDSLIRRVLTAGGPRRWASSPQALLDDLWSAARVPLTGAAILSRLSGAGKALQAALERTAPGWSPDRLPRRLRPVSRAWLKAPSEKLLRAATGELTLPVEGATEPGGEGLTLVLVDASLPRFALERQDDLRAQPRPEGAAQAYDSLLQATLGAEDLAALALADRALAAAEALRDEVHAPEIDLLLALLPAIEALRKGGEVSDGETRIHYLEQARQALEGWGKEAAEGFLDPERTLAATAVGRWREMLARTLAASRGRAEVRLGLRARRLALASASLVVEVEVTSCGSVAAESVTVSVDPGATYRVLGEPKQKLGRLPSGASSVARFQVKPAGAGAHEVSFTARFDDRVAAGNEARLVDRVEVFEVRQSFHRIESNPYIAGPPVKNDRMFFGREDVFAFVRDNLHGRFQSNVLILHGNRRTGKSSILCQLERGDHVAPYTPVYLDLQGLGKLTTGSLFHSLARRMTRALAGRGAEPPEPPPREALDGRDAFEAMNDWLDDLGAGPYGAPRMLVMIDEFEILEDKAREGRVDPEVFGWLRSLMQHSEHLAFILAGTHRLSDMDPVLWAPLHALALYRHIGFLGESEARSLIVEPVKGEVDFDDLALESILRLTAGHPYYTQLLCQLVVNQLNEAAGSNVVLLDDLSRAVERLLDAGGGQFRYEWGAARRDEGRLVLAAIAEAADVASVWVDLEDVAARAGLEREAAAAAAREVTALDLVLHSGGSYRIRMDLFRLWIRREKPVARARA